MSANDTPRVWVGCLGCYSAGRLVGEWYDADTFDDSDWNPPADAETRVEHERDEHDELWVFDHEGFHGLLAGECSPTTARELADLLASVDDPQAYAIYASYVGGEYATVDGFEEAWAGWWDSEEEFAQNLYEDTGTGMSESWPFTCIDWSHAWNELRIGGDYWSEYVSGSGYAIFRTV